MSSNQRGVNLVRGTAGCGKTAYLANLVRDVASGTEPGEGGHPSILVCSLTRTTAAEIAGRDLDIPANQIGTLHAHAYRALGSPEIADGHIAEWNEREPSLALSNTASSDTEEHACEEPPPRTLGDDAYRQYCVARARMTERDRWSRTVVEFANRWEPWKLEEGYTDFADLIEGALERVTCAPGCPRVLVVDEAQDLGLAELRLCLKWGSSAGCVVFAADPLQALYEWRGANPGFFTSSEIPPERIRVLAQSYRVPGVVLATAVAWVSRLSDYRPVECSARRLDPADPSSVVRGEVVHNIGTWRHPEFAVRAAIADVEAGRSVMIAASCSYMLRPTGALLRTSGMPFSNPWRISRGDWNPLGRARRTLSLPQRVLDFLRPSDSLYDPCDPDVEWRPRRWTWKELNSWIPLIRDNPFARSKAEGRVRARVRSSKTQPTEAEVAGLLGEDNANKLASLFSPGADPLIALRWLEEQMLPGRAKAAQYLMWVSRVHGPRALAAPPKLHVGTIHSYKGGSADVVYLFPDISASANRAWHAGGAGRDAVIRTFYVGMTRAREKLVLCGASSRMAVQIVPVQRHGRW